MTGVNLSKAEKPLPQWFDISKYEVSKKIGMKGWFLQLSLRFNVLNNFAQLADKFFELITKNPLPRPMYIYSNSIRAINDRGTVSDGYLDLWGSDFKKIDRAELWKKLAVKPVFFNELPPLAGKAQDYSNNRGSDLNRDVESGNIDLAEFMKRFRSLNEPARWLLAESEDTIFRADLRLSDELLKEHFGILLAKLRNEHAEKKSVCFSISNAQIQDWAFYGVLPYFDLKLWKKRYPGTIQLEKLADLLFSDFEKKQNLLRTTRRYYKDLLDKKFLMAMEAVVAGEWCGPEKRIAGKPKSSGI
ncbi:MAG: hypothetical protein HQM09_24570 [Candidatus Riflebacteria bacterium]|nr:hypothetical protein [Candidatus Riflebacteria bacterium]